MKIIRLMGKWLVLSVFAFLLFLSAGVVSASSWYDYGYGYGGYGSYECGYGYGYGDCYRAETFRDTTENKHTTVSTFEDRYTTEKVKTVTTSYTDIQRETRTPIYSGYSRYPYRTFYYPSRTVIGHVDGYPSSYWRYKEPYDNSDPYHRDSRYSYYYEPRYDSYLGYYNWRY